MANSTASSLDLDDKEKALVIGILRKYLPDCQVLAFGSRTTGQARAFSDLDLAVVSDKPLGLALLAEMKEAFVESDLPWKVDVVDLATVSAAFRRVVDAHHIDLTPLLNESDELC